jgi:hypothetical protein
MQELAVILVSLLDPGSAVALDGPDFPFTYLRGHPSFPTPHLSVSGPYRVVVGQERIVYTGERRQTPIFQLPIEMIRSIRGSDGQLTIRLGDDREWIDIDFRATGVAKKRDMRRLIAAVQKGSGHYPHPHTD